MLTAATAIAVAAAALLPLGCCEETPAEIQSTNPPPSEPCSAALRLPSACPLQMYVGSCAMFCVYLCCEWLHWSAYNSDGFGMPFLQVGPSGSLRHPFCTPSTCNDRPQIAQRGVPPSPPGSFGSRAHDCFWRVAAALLGGPAAGLGVAADVGLAHSLDAHAALRRRRLRPRHRAAHHAWPAAPGAHLGIAAYVHHVREALCARTSTIVRGLLAWIVGVVLPYSTAVLTAVSTAGESTASSRVPRAMS